VEWGSGNVTDLSSADAEEVNGMIAGIPSNTISLNVIKQDGTTMSVKLTKAKLKVEENSISSFVLEGKKRIGYIRLPDFYSSVWENKNVMGCSNDVAKEILKLRKDSIEGLIIDLRFNGGGSLAEAVNLAGIFIDEGPLSVTHFRGEKPVLLKDMNRGTIYDGPLLVLINRASASASEFVAAALQDYRRALIAGSTSYGKGTGQTIVPVDTAYNLQGDYHESKKNFGYLKITCHKIYRLDGKTYQKKGVVPDVLIPDMYDHVLDRESDSPLCLQYDSITKKVLYNPLPGYAGSDIVSKSKARLDADTTFGKVREYNLRLDSMMKTDKMIMLDVAGYRKFQKYVMAEVDKMKSVYSGKSLSYTVKINSYDKEIYDLDPLLKETADDTQEYLLNDIYVDESYKILEDILSK
jgi:carboxyl-terminal processing protease